MPIKLKKKISIGTFWRLPLIMIINAHTVLSWVVEKRDKLPTKIILFGFEYFKEFSVSKFIQSILTGNGKIKKNSKAKISLEFQENLYYTDCDKDTSTVIL